MTTFKESEHPRDEDGKFTDKNAVKSKLNSLLDKATDDRVKVAKISNPIYNHLTLSNGKKISEVLSREIAMPVNAGNAGLKHIESKKERIGIYQRYKKNLPTIVNNPDYVFEDMEHSNTILITKLIKKNAILIVSLNFKTKGYTNTLISLREQGSESFRLLKNKMKKNDKILYINPRIDV